jgi:hypothetical protein
MKNWLSWVDKGFRALISQGHISETNFIVRTPQTKCLLSGRHGACTLAFGIALFLFGFHNMLISEAISPQVLASSLKFFPPCILTVLDVQHIDRWLLGFEFKILAKTATAVLEGVGAARRLVLDFT